MIANDLRGACQRAEGAETIACFAAMMLWPDWFPALALGIAALTLVTALGRAILAWTTFR